MKQINFSHEGGFPLEQETLERLQSAYRTELFGALKAHFSIETCKNYIVATATEKKNGWAIIHLDKKDCTDPEYNEETPEGILYPILKGKPTGYLKTIRKDTNLIYGTGKSQTAYFDYEAVYIEQAEYTTGASQTDKTLAANYHILGSFKEILDHAALEKILTELDTAVRANAKEITKVKDEYLALDGSKTMKGNLNMGTYHISRLDVGENPEANIRAYDFRLGSLERRGMKHGQNYLGRALVDSTKDAATTSLTLNYQADWDHIHIGGKVHLDSAPATADDGSFLLLGEQNQIIRSNSLLNPLLSHVDDLINRVTKLEEKKPAESAIPKGMIAIWGRPASQIPEGWEEYVPLRGRMPVGFYDPTGDEKTQDQREGRGEGVTYYYDNDGYTIYPFDTILNDGGHIKKKILLSEMPSHSHKFTADHYVTGSGMRFGSNASDDTGLVNLETEPSGSGVPFSVMNPYRVIHFIEYTGRPKDTTKPTSPTDLIATNIDNKSLILSWIKSSDDIGVTNYLVYKDNELIVTLGDVSSYPVTGLNPGTRYSFSVKARDKAGNLSDSVFKDATTTATDTINPPMPLSITAYEKTPNYIHIDWEPAPNTEPVTYQLFKKIDDGEYHELAARRLGSQLASEDYGEGNEYNTVRFFYKVRAIDAALNESPFTEPVEVVLPPMMVACFDVESPVTMASGQTKKLKNIVIGDKLQGFSFPNEIDESAGDYFLWNGKRNEAIKTEVTVVDKKTSIQPNFYEIKTGDNIIKVTGEHPLLITEDGESLKWVSAKNVAQNMLLIDKLGKTKAIESILFREEPLEVALLDVENVDNYVISGIVVHNNKPSQPRE
ncbi:fibronectin type III domain-containing protein [Flavobacterium lipolyticum]|uniref:Fibronectin type III domain-containing protein n=1 Tax=Flavobacterium lipolyticum TaxID=2893754 RepID=A0ABS8LVT0_9FLAO|nr:fibronectin type III domain-containing protein [Flavobacterium sp. F-126]MCC9016489.1 fibronectin type III domain-containing protein [Flavobacterium sp. F-126]